MKVTLHELKQIIKEALDPFSEDDPGMESMKKAIERGFPNAADSLATAVAKVIDPGCLSEFEANRVLVELSLLGFEVVKKPTKG